MTIKILNLYAGIGGNRKLWKNVDVTAIESDENIANIYKSFFPEDEVIVTDAHNFLMEHFSEFDFIWSSPPCPTHSRMRKSLINTRCGAKPIFPDMKLYEEILFLQGYFKGKWVVENVISWYAPLITPKKIDRHFYWSNFDIGDFSTPLAKFTLTNGTHKETDKQQVERLSKELGFDLSNFKGNKRTMLRNCVNPETGLHIFETAYPELLSVSHKSHTLASPTFPTEKAINRNLTDFQKENPKSASQTSLNPDIKSNSDGGLQVGCNSTEARLNR